MKDGSGFLCVCLSVFADVEHVCRQIDTAQHSVGKAMLDTAMFLPLAPARVQTERQAVACEQKARYIMVSPASSTCQE